MRRAAKAGNVLASECFDEDAVKMLTNLRDAFVFRATFPEWTEADERPAELWQAMMRHRELPAPFPDTILATTRKEQAMSVSRRDFIKKSTATVAVGLAIPPWLAKMVWAEGTGDSFRQSAQGAKRTLVVIQLTGGNDGLNTVIPYADKAYHVNRPTLAIPDSQVLHLSDTIGLNPAMTAMKGLYDQGQLAVVQGVGYPNPNRSHFRSMEIWQTGQPDRPGTEGWVGRYLDAIRSGRTSPLTGINIGNEQSLATQSAHAAVPSIQGLANFGVVFPHSAEGDIRADTLKRVQLADTNTPYGALFSQVARETYDSADRIRAGLPKYHSTVQYPNGGFGRDMQEVAQLIAADLGTRVFYLSFAGGSFDTHSQQGRRHPLLLSQLSDGLAAFQADLEQMGQADHVLTVCFSEFGRRVHENAGGGTDHGTASEMFVVGKQVKGGLYGAYPSLTDLDSGDLKFTTDFRAVYGTVIDRWLGASSEVVLGKQYEDLKFV